MFSKTFFIVQFEHQRAACCILWTCGLLLQCREEREERAAALAPPTDLKQPLWCCFCQFICPLSAAELLKQEYVLPSGYYRLKTILYKIHFQHKFHVKELHELNFYPVQCCFYSKFKPLLVITSHMFWRCIDLMSPKFQSFSSLTQKYLISSYSMYE